MIYYAIDTPIRTKVAFALAIVAGVSAHMLNTILPSDFSAPSAIGLFGLYYFVFDKYAWRIFLLNKLLGIPDLSGEWVGTIERTDLKSGCKENDLPVRVTINQTWSQLDVVLENQVGDSISGRTLSFTRVAALLVENKKAVMLKYIWEYDKGKGYSEMLYTVRNRTHTLSGHYLSNMAREGYVTITRKAM